MAANDIQLNYAQIEAVSAKLKGAVTEVVPVLSGLRTDVSNLLHDGLVFRQSSPALEASYDKFNNSLIQAVNNINSFAKQFTDIKQQLEDMDGKMSSSISSGSSE
ncbi:hypothetical protein [Streptomyces lunalinharesii]|uniref:Proteins of 100 residues with WXG n=1 Tax=Streptomyces lunalinharesii TaxID=333384 RepID=A0ABN3SN56_9ACTN